MSEIHIFHLVLILSLGSAKLTSNKHRKEYNLPTYVIPSHYTLDLTLDPNEDTYNGSVEIKFSSLTTLHDIIKLHASPKTIKIHSAMLNYNHSCTVTETNNYTEIVILSCPPRSFQLENTLTVRFRGKYLTEESMGLFKTTYTEDGHDHVVLATFFEPMNARQAFPCFDEPKWKATFDIFITHPKDYTALANTPVIRKFLVSSDRVQTQFKTSPPMSTYLVAFVVSKFTSNTDNVIREYDYQVFARSDAKNFTSIAVTYGPTLIDLLSNWTGIAYKDLGNTQVYQVAIPTSESIAMENWGLITFGEFEMLDEKEITSSSLKQDIILLLTHELAHQWFGNYVTLNWWSDTWLNEGFATYFQYYITDQLDDNLETMKQFSVKEREYILEIDATSSALPLSSYITTKYEGDNKFDDITYLKGASIVRMLRNVIGEVAFREGIQSYLSNYKYNNTNPYILLKSFKVDTSTNLYKIMNNWIYKAGFPLVTATLNGSAVIVTQKRFTVEKSNGDADTEWYIPITYTTKTEKNFDFNVKGWLTPNSTFEIKLGNDSWIILNMQQIGYYRVNYDDSLWLRIIQALKTDRNSIYVLNRAQLISDIFSIASIGLVSYRIAFHLADYLRSETEYYPWVSALNALSLIYQKLDDDKTEKLLQSRILYWLNNAFPPKTYKIGSNHVDKLKEVLILDWACKLGQEECIVYAKETFQKFKVTYSLPDNDKRGIVFCYGFRNSSNPAEDYDFLLKLYQNSSSIFQQKDILSSLGCSNNADLLTKYLTETVTDNSSIKKQDAKQVFEAVYRKSKAGVDASLSFLENNLKNLTARFNVTDTLLNFIEGIGAEKVVSENQCKRISKIFDKCSDIDGITGIRQIVFDFIDSKRTWKNKYAAEVKAVLQELFADVPKVLKPS